MIERWAWWRFITTLSGLLLLGLVVGCLPRQEWSVDSKTDVVVYMNQNATREEVNQFWHEVVGNPVSSTATELLPGISGVMATYDVDGHEAIAVEFWWYATPEEREYVMSRIRSAPMVYKVLEDVAPAEVNSLD